MKGPHEVILSPSRPDPATPTHSMQGSAITASERSGLSVEGSQDLDGVCCRLWGTEMGLELGELI